MAYFSLLLLLFLSSCAAQMHPLKPQLHANIHTIDLAKIEMTHTIHIRRISLASVLMGSSGLVLDSIAMAQSASRYQNKAGDVAIQCLKTFQQQLIQSLEKHGYHIRYSNKPYWDYFKPSQKALRQSSDGILHIHFEQQGFFSKGFQSPYQPSVFIVAELINPKTRKVLYRDQFASGIDDKDLELFKLYFGDIQSIANPADVGSYQNIKDLLEHSHKSRQDLLDTVAYSSQHIAQGLKPPSLLSSSDSMPLKLTLDASLTHD